jgi:hypothetical protein
MKKGISNKLTLGKKTISKLQELEQRGVNGGSSYPSYVSCPTASCASVCFCGSGSGGSESIGREPGGGAQYLIQPEPYYC